MKRYAHAFAALFISGFMVLAISPPAFADQIGVVIMHGKGGKNMRKAPTKILARFLEDESFLVTAPDMPWQRDRIYDKDVNETMAEIDEAVAELKSEGADRIVVAGHSLGANAAIAYAARRDGLAGVIAIAPGHTPEFWADRFGADVARARAMVEAGNGEDEDDFNDLNQGEDFARTVKARIYLSWFDPDGDAVMPKNAANIRPGTPLMWIVGKDDSMADQGEDYAFAKAPEQAKNNYVVIGGGHRATPKKGKREIAEWLNGL